MKPKALFFGIAACFLFFGGCGGGGGGSGGGDSGPVKLAIWAPPSKYVDDSDILPGELVRYWIYVKTDNTFSDADAIADDVDAASVTRVDPGTSDTIGEYNLWNAQRKNGLNVTDNYFVSIRAVSIYGVSDFAEPSRAFSFSEQ